MQKSTPSPGPSLRRFSQESGSLVTLDGEGQATRRMDGHQVLAEWVADQYPGREILVCFENPDGAPDLANGIRTSDAAKAAQTWRRLCGAARARQRQPQPPAPVSPPQRPRAAGRTRRERRSSPTRGPPDSDDDPSSSEPPGYATGRHLAVVRVAARYTFACLPLEARS